MESLRIIKSFLKLLDEEKSKEESLVFPLEAREALTELNKELNNLSDDQPFLITKAITTWCQDHPGVREALKRCRVDIGESDEEIEEADPRYQAAMLENITLLRKTLQEKPPQNNPDTNNPNEQQP
jgi:hypothetical protein